MFPQRAYALDSERALELIVDQKMIRLQHSKQQLIFAHLYLRQLSTQDHCLESMVYISSYHLSFLLLALYSYNTICQNQNVLKLAYQLSRIFYDSFQKVRLIPNKFLVIFFFDVLLKYSGSNNQIHVYCMEDKIQKIFSYFGNIKNQPFYTSCISQIIEIYQSNSESLKFILYNLNHLIFSDCKQGRLRLKHRLICASLISKLNKIYVQRVKQFVQDKLNFELQSFQLQSGGTQKLQTKSKPQKWEQMDILKIIESEELLTSSSKAKRQALFKQQKASGINENNIFDSFIDMNHASMLNIQHQFKDVQYQNQFTDEAFQIQKSKYKQKLQKINTKSKEQISLVELIISNPFNLMYQICIANLLNDEWELRHLAVLILKELLLHSQFLGFSFKFSLRRQDSTQERFQYISNTTKDMLRKHIADVPKKKLLIDDIIAYNIKVLALDRFADYQSEASIIVVRMVSAEILAICFKALENTKQAHMIKMIRKIFEKESPFNNQNASKFSWQVKHGFLYFLNLVIEKDRSYGKLLCSQLQESFIKMLANDHFDEITLCICKVIQSFLGEAYFTPQKIDRTNRQIWGTVQGLDDISISAKQILELLLKLFPYFKLNEGNCIDRLKKFFTSKISEVRKELYRLIGCLYARKKDIADAKLIQRNLVQLLQAVIIQFDSQNFKELGDVMPHIMPYILKTKNIRKIVQFINTCVTPNQYTEQIINGKFILGVQKSQCLSNDYLYIYQQENVYSPLSAYTDKRLWKISLGLKEMFRFSSQGLEELLKGIEKNNQKNHRAKILIYNLLNNLMPQYKTLKLFEQYKEQISKIIIMEYGEITDNQIIKFYIPEMDKQMKKITEDQKYQNTPQLKDHVETVKEIYQTLKKSDFSLKNGLEISRKLNVIYHLEIDPIFLGQIENILRIMNNIVKIQRQLCKNIKILAVRYLIQYNEPNEVGNLNVVIKSIMQAIKQDNYNFISETVAKAALGLTVSLYKNKKAICSRFNSNLCNHISLNYQVTQYQLKQHPNSVKLQGTYMTGMCNYIELMGKTHIDYLKEASKYYLQENMEQKQGKIPIIEQQYNRILTLLSGTITTLLKIDKKPIDQDGYFITKFIKKISTILSTNCNNLQESIHIKIKRILSDSFIYLSQNYSAISNIFFEWFLKEMQTQNIIFFEILQKISTDHIAKIASVASLFVLQIIKSITIVKLHDRAMNSLSNIIVGVYTNIVKNGFSQPLAKISQEGIQFVKNFKNTSNFDYKLNVKLSQAIDLRAYQLQGISWLGFLTKFNLSGALCDDMGLGKTLQTLVVLQNQYINCIKTQSNSYLHSLIVCPATLMQHWAFQYKKYFPHPVCEVVILDKLKKISEIPKKTQKPHLFISSYNMIEKIDVLFENVNLKFIILDEGHLIKNTKTNKFKAIKRLKGLHRFILTGTPIQNRLIELWGLFDFLMPGYLYAEDLFKKHYQKLFEVNLVTFKEDELLFSQQQRKTLQKLHFKVMPFIMRRMKGDVLRELPQKIINDYYCVLTECQIKHYKNLQERIKIQSENKEINALGNLHQMIKIVNHPYLGDLQSHCTWQDSGKFVALGELFQQFGFTQDDSMLHNKVIIFAKQKNTIDLIEKYLKQRYKGINYLKLTSDIREGDRFTVAQTFNGDSDIKILLVTKAIGGVGLNLSSANCVIMFDSDYNPTVDMQAIDRAHRIGQKRVLNVYRLITKDTLEEKIMGIQKFKTNLANAIVNIDNSSIKNVQESKLPDLLQNIRDLQKTSKQVQAKIGNVMYGAIIAEMEKNAIESDQFLKRY